MMTREGVVLQRVKEKMPWAQDVNIVIQHDGAKSHEGKGNDALLLAVGQLYGWNITFETQPLQYPDLNMCDLCLFASLQAHSHIIRDRMINNLSHDIRALEHRGSNQYKMPLLSTYNKLLRSNR